MNPWDSRRTESLEANISRSSSGARPSLGWDPTHDESGTKQKSINNLVFQSILFYTHCLIGKLPLRGLIIRVPTCHHAAPQPATLGSELPQPQTFQAFHVPSPWVTGRHWWRRLISEILVAVFSEINAESSRTRWRYVQNIDKTNGYVIMYVQVPVYSYIHIFTYILPPDTQPNRNHPLGTM